ncbi:hypothetical protein IFT59_21460 [Rhizobium sp. CFBP 8752]|jgi:hypothetical protein|uniref:hypothetical protein n=1 Tax=Rhizobium sp. CFBP 8752 TaxID=2775301 RepID=UPI0013AED7B4|nr:hypothetical protein [Rhizobium sp. CFBP 8752]MBD8665817.1 hypothetical protein [Rhizobium sp. CFBP 8752]
MTEPKDVTEEADKTLIEHGHQRFKESVDTSRTPQQERREAGNQHNSPAGYGTTK